MKWVEPQPHLRITKANGQRHQGECLITWEWPKDIHYVYVYTCELGEEQPAERLTPKQLKLMTREEYKSSAGCRDRGEFIGVKLYRIFPCLRVDGELTAVQQRDDANLVRMNGGRAQIRYAVKYGRGWFSKRKQVTLELFCEIDVPREAICYVKKAGSEPLNREDGVAYPFQGDFPAGQHRLPEFEVGRDEYVRMFLSDGKRYGDIYELIREK